MSLSSVGNKTVVTAVYNVHYFDIFHTCAVMFVSDTPAQVAASTVKVCAIV